MTPEYFNDDQQQYYMDEMYKMVCGEIAFNITLDHLQAFLYEYKMVIEYQSISEKLNRVENNGKR